MTTTITTVCPMCGKVTLVIVNSNDLLTWKNGGLAYDCFPYLSAEEREALISGICPTCWDSVFPEEEEEVYENDDEMGFNPYLGCYDFDC